MNNVTVRAAQPLSDAAKAILDAAPRHWIPYALGLLVGYPLLTSGLRYQRLRTLHKKYPYATRADMAKMTDDHAFEIQKSVAQLEFPFMFIKALQFALFRTYGIPTISRLLTTTTQFSNPETSLKRYTDTSALIQEMVGNSPTSQRAYISLARTRFLHSGYRASGKILDDDMLYTLALFALQPIRFINRFEWRQLSDLERCAIGTFWKSVGDALEISYAKLPSGTAGFQDGIQWLDELDAWSEMYEVQCMVPDAKNRETADQTTAILVYMLPTALHPVGLEFVSFMMDDRLRRAMLYDPPSSIARVVFSSLLTIRKLFLRYLCPPRPYFLRYASFTEEPDENNRFFLTEWEAAPYYVKPTFWNRWGPMAWVTRMLGRPLPGDEGDKYYPHGYHIQDMGPRYFEGKGRKALEEAMEEFKEYRTGKCPFH
ncbi:uncharacterized protein N7482_005615 [Penicillium canariense]|uniref:ER-bound oxygenase mpaB/mpaB'/Rubber oxygenase catalytic domain-containing protein n=1 Tax=Penicillium canariense TaxID=189055 RepID=A0A9W9I552_9EURO|nr:uncharacterized protein N7482_005615 [Penicillium canariense]KAJ5166834.1 hypothetical protein N7482_005615 [Penicillium canariense]